MTTTLCALRLTSPKGHIEVDGDTGVPTRRRSRALRDISLVDVSGHRAWLATLGLGAPGCADLGEFGVWHLDGTFHPPDARVRDRVAAANAEF